MYLTGAHILNCEGRKRRENRAEEERRHQALMVPSSACNNNIRKWCMNTDQEME
jgi:hypothetical protein